MSQNGSPPRRDGQSGVYYRGPTPNTTINPKTVITLPREDSRNFQLRPNINRENSENNGYYSAGGSRSKKNKHRRIHKGTRKNHRL